MKNQSSYPLRRPKSIKAEVDRLAKEDGISINQFIATAVAEKLSACARRNSLPSAGPAPISPRSIG